MSLTNSASRLRMIRLSWTGKAGASKHRDSVSIADTKHSDSTNCSLDQSNAGYLILAITGWRSCRALTTSLSIYRCLIFDMALGQDSLDKPMGDCFCNNLRRVGASVVDVKNSQLLLNSTLRTCLKSRTRTLILPTRNKKT
jgi:hypothetical protein